MFETPEITYYTPEEAAAKKRAFALALMLDPFHPEKAAMAVEPRLSHSSYILTHWQYDREVNAIMEAEFMAKGAKSKIPSKEEFAASLIDDANSCRDKEIKLDYLKLFATVVGYIEKPAAVSVQQNNTVNNVKHNVIIMPEMRDGFEIEAEIMEQQRLLTSK